MRLLMKFRIGIGIATAALLCVTVMLVYARVKISKIGTAIGGSMGEVVGMAVGSYHGVTTGIEEGMKNAEHDAMAAPEIQVDADIKGTMESIGKLDVLAAGVRLQNLHEVGNTYQVLYVAKGDAIFSVDLTQASVSYNSDGSEVFIWIPEIELEIYYDENGTEKIAEKSNFSPFAGAKDGINAYLNSIVKITENVKDTMVNYDFLMSTAKESAIRQITKLAETVCGRSKTVHVEFQKGSG